MHWRKPFTCPSRSVMRVSRGGSYVSGKMKLQRELKVFALFVSFPSGIVFSFPIPLSHFLPQFFVFPPCPFPPLPSPPQFVQPTGKRFLLALDVSGSMGGYNVLGSASIDARVASAAMSMVTARTEANYKIVGFSHHLVPLNIKASMSLEEVIQTIERVSVSSSSSSSTTISPSSSFEHGYPVYYTLRSIPTLIFCHRCPWGEQTVLSR